MRLIDADAYAAEMKVRQDALKELMDDADALENWDMYDGLSREFSVFVEAIDRYLKEIGDDGEY